VALAASACERGFTESQQHVRGRCEVSGGSGSAGAEGFGSTGNQGGSYSSSTGGGMAQLGLPALQVMGAAIRLLQQCEMHGRWRRLQLWRREWLLLR